MPSKLSRSIRLTTTALISAAIATLLFAGVTDFSGLTGTGLFSGLNGSGATSSLANSVFVTGDTPFTTSSLSFIANGSGSLRFAFGSSSQDDIGPLLDNISLRINPAALTTVSAVPEPSTWTMLLLGFGAVGFGMRRCQHRAVNAGFA